MATEGCRGRTCLQNLEWYKGPALRLTKLFCRIFSLLAEFSIGKFSVKEQSFIVGESHSCIPEFFDCWVSNVKTDVIRFIIINNYLHMGVVPNLVPLVDMILKKYDNLARICRIKFGLKKWTLRLKKSWEFIRRSRLYSLTSTQFARFLSLTKKLSQDVAPYLRVSIEQQS
jgi:hypothetical protein